MNAFETKESTGGNGVQANGGFEQDPRNSIEGWFFTAEEIAFVLANGHMINPSIDLSNPCNLNCPYCYIEEKNSSRKVRKPNELTHQETVTLIQELRSCGAKTINLVGAGEPTIDPHFEETVELIDGLGMKTVLFTNGIRFCNDSNLLKFVCGKKISVVLKYNAISNEVQDLVAGRKGYAQKRDRALELFQDGGLNSHYPTRLGLDTIVFQGNLAEMPEIHRMCRRENIFPIAGEYIPTGRTENGKFQGFNALRGFTDVEKESVSDLLQPITSDQRLELFRKLAEIDLRFEIRRNGACAYYGGGICTQILGLYIDIQGNVWPCVARSQRTSNGMEGGLLGNIRNGESPAEIWKQHPYIRAIRQHFNGGCPYKQGLSSDSPHDLQRI